MADTYTDKYVINRLRDSYYQKTTTISGFFTTKKTEWDDLCVKGFRYCPSGWLHSNHKEYVEFLNRHFNYEYSSYKNFITKYSKLITILNQFCIYKCHNHAYSRYFSLILVSRDFVTKTKYDNKYVEKITFDMSYKESEGRIYQDAYVITIYFSNNGGTESISFAPFESNIISDILAIGCLLQLDKDPNCMAYYVYNQSNFLEIALSYGWIKQ